LEICIRIFTRGIESVVLSESEIF